MNAKAENSFSKGAATYAKHRPTYPNECAKALAKLCPNTHLAIEVGCGNGQFSQCLAKQFEKVIATDLSDDQIRQAVPHHKIIFKCEPAEKISVDDSSASLIVAAQAAHWFDRPVFYKEAKRVAVNEAIIALLSYGILNIEGEADERFQKFYWDEIHSFWAPDRKHVETGYKDFDFPFTELTLPPLNIICHWDFNQFIGYLKTWSAMKTLKAEGEDHIFDKFYSDMKDIWGEAEQRKTITWPISSRVGRIEG